MIDKELVEFLKAFTDNSYIVYVSRMYSSHTIERSHVFIQIEKNSIIFGGDIGVKVLVYTMKELKNLTYAQLNKDLNNAVKNITLIKDQ